MKDELEDYIANLSKDKQKVIAKVSDQDDVFNSVASVVKTDNLKTVLGKKNKGGKGPGGGNAAQAGFRKDAVDLDNTVVFRYTGRPEVLEAYVNKLPTDIEVYSDNTFPNDNRKVVVEPKGKGEFRVKVNLNKRDYIAVEPADQSLFWRVYTPYTGRNFYFVLKDSENVRTFDLHGKIRRSADKSNQFARLMMNSTQLGFQIGKRSILNRAFTFWDTQFREIIEKHQKYQENLRERRNNFRLRVGDVIRDVYGEPDKYVITHKVYNPETNRFRWMMLPLERKDSSDAEDYLVFVDTQTGKNPLADDPFNARYSDSLPPEDVKQVRQNVSDEVNNMLKAMGLNERNESGYEPRDHRRELPPRPDRGDRDEKTITDVTAGYMVYIGRTLPSQNTPIVDRNGKNLTRDFPNSEGWYIITDKKDVQNSNNIRWTLVPATGDSVEISNPTYDSSKRPIREREFWNYIVIDLPAGGDGSLTKMIEDSETIHEQERYRRALNLTKRSDPKGNDREIKAGDVIRYGSENYIVGNKKPKGDQISWMLLPVRALTDPTRLSGQAEDPTAGYIPELMKPKEGRGSLEEEATRYFTAQDAKKMGLMDKAKNYFRIYDENGRPRAKPLSPDQLSGFDQKNQKKPSEQPTLDTRFFSDDLNENKDKNVGPDPYNRNKSGMKDQVLDRLDRKVNNHPGSKDSRGTNTYDLDNMDEDTPEGQLIQDLRNGKIHQGSIILYRWSPDKGDKQREIFYEYDPETSYIRLVPHYNFRGPEDGWVEADGYAGKVTNNDFARFQSFWQNFRAGAYDDSSLPSAARFSFEVGFENKFAELVDGTNSTNSNEDNNLSGTEPSQELPWDDDSNFSVGPTSPSSPSSSPSSSPIADNSPEDNLTGGPTETQEKDQNDQYIEAERQDIRRAYDDLDLEVGDAIEFYSEGSKGSDERVKGIVEDINAEDDDPLNWYVSVLNGGEDSTEEVSFSKIISIADPRTNGEMYELLGEDQNYKKAFNAYLKDDTTTVDYYKDYVGVTSEEELVEVLNRFYLEVFGINPSL